MLSGLVKHKCCYRSWMYLRGQLPRLYSTNNPADEIDYLQPQNTNHHDLSSFLEYASRNSLDVKSTTYVGTHYEYTVQGALKRMGMTLTRTGGASDKGIDLLGTWNVPSFPEPLKVLLQCKAYAQRITPATARELGGALEGAPPGWRGSHVLALLVTPKPATKGVRDAIGKSISPMGFVLCEQDGRIRQLLWNRKAEEAGLGGLGVDLVYMGGDPPQKEVVLTWKGKVISE